MKNECALKPHLG